MVKALSTCDYSFISAAVIGNFIINPELMVIVKPNLFKLVRKFNLSFLVVIIALIMQCVINKIFLFKIARTNYSKEVVTY